MTIDLKVDGMTCLDCSQHVTAALKRVPGVRSAAVDYRAGRATVEGESDVAPEALTAAVERAGYHGEVLTSHMSNGASALTLFPGSLNGATGTPSFASEPPRRTVPSEGRRDSASETGPAGFDLLVIGTGGAGMAAAIQAVGMGAKVAIVEAGTVGGTCVNVGCIPSKNLIEAAAHYHAARRGFPGIGPCEPSLDWQAIVRHKDELVTELRQAKYADVLASYPGIALLRGQARLVSSSMDSADGGSAVRVLMAGNNGEGEREHLARKVVIATGTSPSEPALPGLDGVGPLDSATAMELETLPSSMIVLGGGPVGVELGQVFARFGTKVVIVQRGAHLLPHEDPEISDALRGFLEAEGIEVHTSMQATGVERDGDGVVMHVTQGSLTGELRAERILVAAGRRPNTAGLGLGEAAVALNEKGYVQVDATMRTSNPNVYAAGDVTGGPGYVYVAAAGGRVAAENAMKSLSPAGTPSVDPREFDLSVVPNVTFTAPQVGSVGLTEARARELGHNVQVAILPIAQVPRALVSYDTRGFVKVVADAASGKLLGIHAVAPNAGEFMGEAALAIRFGLTARDVSGTLHPYLTWVESVKLAAQGLIMDVSKLSCCA